MKQTICTAVMSYASLTIDFSVGADFTAPVSTKKFVLEHQILHELQSMLQHVMHRLPTNKVIDVDNYNLLSTILKFYLISLLLTVSSGYAG